MPGDDLVPLLIPSNAPTVGFRQGVVLAWNQDTAENTVQVAGSILTDLPILNTSEAQLLEPGAVVGIMTAGSSWFVMGRITVPGTADAASALSLVSRRIQASSDTAQGTRSATTYGDLTGAAVGPAVTLTVSSSGKALAFWSADHGETGGWETDVQDGVSVAVSGATTVAASASFAIGHRLTAQSATGSFSYGTQTTGMHLFTGLNAGVHTFTLEYRSGTGQTIQFRERELAVFAL
jgi:hypothetical protein